MRRNGYLWTFGVNLGTAVQFPDPDFLLECKISTIWRRFPLIFLHYICWMSAIFLFPVCFTYWPRKYTTRVDPHVDNSHQVWGWYDHTLPSYTVFVCWYVTWLLTLNSCHAWRVTWPTLPPSLMTLRLFVHELRVITVPMHTRPLRMRRITWPVNRESKTITFLESPTPICLFTINFYWATTTISPLQAKFEQIFC